MEPERKIAYDYIQLLESNNIRAKKSSEASTSHQHLLWMLYEIATNKEMSQTKRNRWLGFVQGCLSKDDVLAPQNERDRTRQVFNGQ